MRSNWPSSGFTAYMHPCYHTSTCRSTCKVLLLSWLEISYFSRVDQYLSKWTAYYLLVDGQQFWHEKMRLDGWSFDCEATSWTNQNISNHWLASSKVTLSTMFTKSSEWTRIENPYPPQQRQGNTFLIWTFLVKQVMQSFITLAKRTYDINWGSLPGSNAWREKIRHCRDGKVA